MSGKASSRRPTAIGWISTSSTCCREFASCAYGQAMRERKWGRILFISSESGLLTPVEMINYGITKTAQAALARGLAREFGGCGVTVNAVLPGPTRTEGISRMLASESKRTGKSIRKLEAEFFSVARPTSIIRRLSEPHEVA